MTGLRRRAAALAALGLTLPAGLVACSDDGDSTTPTSRQTEFTSAIPPPSVTVAPVDPGTTTPVETQPVLPTAPPTSGGGDPGTALPCDAGVLLAAVAASQGALPPGTGTEPPVCVSGWASMVIGAPGQDRALAVFVAEPNGWRVVSLGVDGVCTAGGVPPELYGELGCALWETS